GGIRTGVLLGATAGRSGAASARAEIRQSIHRRKYPEALGEFSGSALCSRGRANVVRQFVLAARSSDGRFRSFGRVKEARNSVFPRIPKSRAGVAARPSRVRILLSGFDPERPSGPAV